MENSMNYVKPELLILVPVLFALGMALKKAKKPADKHIPLALGAVGILLAGLWVLATSHLGGAQGVMLAVFTALCQGVLAAAGAVYGHQIYKQMGKGE